MEERARRTNRNNNTTTSHSNHPSKLFDAIKDPPLGFFPKKFIDFLTGTWIFKLYFSSARWFPRVFFLSLSFFFFHCFNISRKKFSKENSRERKKVILSIVIQMVKYWVDFTSGTRRNTCISLF